MYVRINTLFLADVFENFQNMCLKKYKLDPVHFLSAPGLTWKADLRKIKVKLDLLTDFDMLLMVQNGIRGGICHSTYQYVKANSKYMKNYYKNKESSCLQYWNINNLYGSAISQKLLINNSERIEDTSQFNEDFIKKCNEESDEGYFLEVTVQYLEKFHELHNYFPFLSFLKKLQRVIRFNQNAWLKPYIDEHRSKKKSKK